MANNRTQLLTRKGDLMAALRTLQQDHEDGVIDDGAYHAARRRYEQEAAEVLERLDALPPEPGDQRALPERVADRAQARPAGFASPWLFAAGAGAIVVAAAIVLFLVTSVQPRSSNVARSSGGGPATAKPLSPAIVAAQREVRAHPRSVTALITLGDAYLNNGQATTADSVYQRAMKVEPNAPQPPTLHAMIIGYSGQTARALAVLHGVERRHPSFSRAWLLDGVFSAHGPRGSPGYKHAILAWQQFLALEPHNSLSAQVRQWIAGAKKALNRTR
jgi:cytochrome c-type biogenesis protein CcmH/NrfG